MKILFITSTRIGDAILSTGLISHLAKTYPNAKITVACGPPAAPLFEACPAVEQTIIMDKNASTSLFSNHWFLLWKETVRTRWDMVIDLRSSLTGYFLRANKRFLWSSTDSLSHHRVEQLGQVLKLSPPPSPTLWTRPIHIERAKDLIPEGPPVLVLGAASNWRGKQWRAEHFIELMKELTKKTGLFPKYRVAVFTTESERSQVEPLLKAIPNSQRLDLVGKTDLLTTYACLKRCAFFIGNDSGLMHLAATANIPTLGLFGPSRHEHYAPWSPTKISAYVRTKTPYDKLTDIEGYDHRTTDSLMDSLSVKSVVEATKSLFQQASKTQALRKQSPKQHRRTAP